MGYLHRVSKLGAFVVSMRPVGGVCDVGMEIGLAWCGGWLRCVSSAWERREAV